MKEIRYILTALSVAVCSPAIAQVNDIQSESLAKASVAQAEGFSSASNATGHADLFILQKRQLFTADASINYGYEDNASGTDKGPNDRFWSARAGLNASTVIDRTYSVSIGLSADWQKNRKFHDLGGTRYGASLDVSRPYDAYTIGVHAGGALLYDDESSDHLVNMSYAFGSVARSLVVDRRVSSVIQVIGGYVNLSQNDFSHYRLDLSFRNVAPINRNIGIKLDFGVGLSDYPDFFGNVLSEDRRDYRASATVGLTYITKYGFPVEVNVSGNYRDSSINIFDYASFGAEIGTSLRVAF